ncbi:hypothetical protein KQI84_07725 [bacterium]|nr:hypothetical protein [bacterium]
MIRLLVTLLVLGCASTALAATPISVEDLQSLRENGQRVMVVDVRSETDFARGHIVGAASIPAATIPYRAIPTDLTIVVVDDDLSAQTADKAAAALEDAGAAEVRTLTGGYTAWRRAKAPTVSPAGTSTESVATKVTAADLREALLNEAGRTDSGKQIRVIQLTRDLKRAPEAVIPGAEVVAFSRDIKPTDYVDRAARSDEVVVIADDGTADASRWAAALLAAGHDARVLAGGTAAWRLSEPKTATTEESAKATDDSEV